MMRNILAVFVGFVAWSLLWFSANAVLGATGQLPPPGEAVTGAGVLVIMLAISMFASAVAGASASWLARSQGLRIALWLGIVLLGVGVIVQIQYWDLMPVWYHAAFLLLLLPMCLLGSMARQRYVPTVFR